MIPDMVLELRNERLICNKSTTLSDVYNSARETEEQEAKPVTCYSLALFETGGTWNGFSNSFSGL